MSQLLWQLLLLFLQKDYFFSVCSFTEDIGPALLRCLSSKTLSAGAQGLVSPSSSVAKISKGQQPLHPCPQATHRSPLKDWQLLVTPILASSLFVFSLWGFLYSLGSSVRYLKECSSFFSVSSTVQQLALQKLPSIISKIRLPFFCFWVTLGSPLLHVLTYLMGFIIPQSPTSQPHSGERHKVGRVGVAGRGCISQ